MPTTSNFGWTTPADTDLVKDGAAAIRTLGNGVDTSFVDLKGGTTGQILSKASNTDLDYTWIANDQGDITEVSAGTGISVASGTGPVPVITNTVATAFDAAGDLVYGTGADTFTKLALGTAGKVLAVNSGATAPEWITPAGGMTLLASGSLSSSQVDITSISGSYINLQLFVKAYRPSADTDLKFRFNSDSNTRYRTYEANGTGNDFNLTFMRFCNSNQDSVTGQGFFVATIYDYTNTTSWKIADTTAVFNNGTTATNADYFRATSAYNQTGAITAINIFPSSGTFSAGTYALYGVK